MKELMVFLSVFVLFGCSSTTYIKSIPSGAKVYNEDSLKGVTPYMHWDRDAGGSSKTLTLQKEGYKDKTITIKKTEFNPVRLFGPPILALPWIYDYPAEYVFELEKNGQKATAKEPSQNIPVSSNLETQAKSSDVSEYSQKLRELRNLKDEGLLSDDEYEQKRKIIVDGI